MSTLEIKKTDAVTAHSNTNRKGRKLLEDLFGIKTFQKKVTDCIKTIEDVLEDNGISEDEHLQKKNTLLNIINMPHLYWQWIAELLCKSLNEGWVPDWDNSNERKYTPWFKMGSGGFRYHDYVSWGTYSIVGSRLCLKSSDLAEYAGTQFTEVYENFISIK